MVRMRLTQFGDNTYFIIVYNKAIAKYNILNYILTMHSHIEELEWHTFMIL